MHTSNEETFGTIRSYVWPIYRHERRKLLPMFLLLFLICFNYTLLRNLKDTIVITAKNSGAEVLPFIKVWVMFPAAVLSTMAFTFLSNKFSRDKVFYIVISFFLSYIFLFTFFIYPAQQALFADTFADKIQTLLPAGCKGLIALVRHWPLTLFYVLAELWSTIVLTVLFWSFANEITKLSEATRFYSTLNISSNVASIVAGQVGAILSTFVWTSDGIFRSYDAWGQSLEKMTIIMLLSGAGILLIFRWMTKYILHNPQYLPEELIKKEKKKKNLSFRESLSYVAHSKYLLSIALIVVSYNLVNHMIEVIWKDRLAQLHSTPNEYNAYMNNLTSLMGIISTIAALLMSGIIRKLGWTKTALITPMVLFVTTCAFFMCLLVGDHSALMISTFFGTTPIMLAVFLGSTQNCFTKAAKYSLYDTTREMAFIPLDPEVKLKGKTAIDGIGSRLGKSGGSLIHQGLLLVFCSLSSSTPYVAVILLVTMCVWILAVRSLGKQFQEKTQMADAEGVATEQKFKYT